MYILKTKGTAKIPDYIQIRDEAFTLIRHIKASIIEEELQKTDFNLGKQQIEQIKTLEPGKIIEIKIEN